MHICGFLNVTVFNSFFFWMPKGENDTVDIPGLLKVSLYVLPGPILYKT